MALPETKHNRDRDMENASDIIQRTDRLRALFEKHMGVRAPTLERAVRRAGRRLPRALRQKAQTLVEAENLAVHPKLERRIDQTECETAYRALAAHLKTLDLAQERRTRLLNTLAAVAFNLLAFAILMLIVLRWQGLV
ncbi:MAG: hypothetical protein V2I76_03450 [Roseobacter sp.]|jgi:hypothetical protein|nr:hypothetical protein [Roseobacter sp.]